MIKKFTIILLTAICCLNLTACGGGANSNDQAGDNSVQENVEDSQKEEFTIDDIIGKWVSDETKQIITIKANETILFSFDASVPLINYPSAAKVDGNQVDLGSFSTYTLETDGDTLKMTCNETNTVQKDTVFVFEKPIYTDEEIYTDWTDPATGDKLVRVENGLKLIYSSGNAVSTYDKFTTYTNKRLYIHGIGEFEILNEDGTLKLKNESNEFIHSDEVAEAQASNGSRYMTVDGIYVDNSYSTSNSDSTRFLYIVYTAHTDAENLKIDCKSMKITINDTNTYTAVRSKKQVRYMKNYYNGAYLESVNIGESKKFVETFEVPEAELEEGRSIKISKSQIPESDNIVLSTDEIVFCDSPEEIAEKVDPEGFEEESWALQDAESEVVQAVKNEINGYQWDVYANSMTYQIEFWEPNNYELRTKISTSDGTYEVKNGYIICTNDIGGVIEIPFTYEDGSVDVDVTAGFDVYN